MRAQDGTETRVRPGAAPVPSEFPPGMPLYPGTHVLSTARSAQSVGITLSTHASPEEVRTFYRKQPGYSVISDTTVNGFRVLHLKHDPSGKDLEVLTKRRGQSTDVTLDAPL